MSVVAIPECASTGGMFVNRNTAATAAHSPAKRRVHNHTTTAAMIKNGRIPMRASVNAFFGLRALLRTALPSFQRSFRPCERAP
jgi:hypothetical protein